jgi:hypothetical protein
MASASRAISRASVVRSHGPPFLGVLVGDAGEQFRLAGQYRGLFARVGGALFVKVSDAAHQVGGIGGGDVVGHGSPPAQPVDLC